MPDPFSEIRPPELRAAARKVAAVGRPENGRSPLVDEILAIAGELAGPRAASRDAPLPTIHRSVIDHFRTALLQEWSGKPPQDAAAIIGVLQRLDALANLPGEQADATALIGSGGIETAAEIAHDFRSPLGSILLLADTLQKGLSGPVSGLQRRQLGIIYSAALALSSFADDIIDVVRGGNGLIEPEPRPFSMWDLLLSLGDLVQPLADGKDLELRVTSEIPETADLRLGYPVMLQRVLLNLTTNALKFTDTGWVELLIEPLSPERLTFTIRDSGAGVPEHVLAKIRQAYGQAPATEPTTRVSSSALGLGICIRLLRAMGSELRVESTANAGSRFEFQLDVPPYLVPADEVKGDAAERSPQLRG